MRRLLALFACAALSFAQQPSPRYPVHWWTPVPEEHKPDWEILPQAAKPGEVIASKRNELGILSNFTATPFTLRGRRYASVEGFWQMMLYPENASDPRAASKNVTWRYTRQQVAQLTSFTAKEAGTLAERNMQILGIDWVTFEGKRMRYRSLQKADHYRLIHEAMLAKLNQNPKVREILLSTGTLILRPDHIQEPDAPPEWLYCNIWMEIRAQLQQTAAAEFYDEPAFTVAGLTDNTYAGGHGSDTVVRSAESLAQSTASLNPDAVARRDPIQTVRQYQQAAELDPTEPNLFNWGAELLVHRAPDPAIKVFNKGMHLYPRSSRMLLGTAAAFYAKGDYPRAAPLFLAATDINPADPGPYLFLAKIEAPEITTSSAFVDRLARLARIQPANPQANYAYAAALLKQPTGSPDVASQARALLNKATRLDPHFGGAYLQLGILASQAGDIPAAIDCYQKAIQADPKLEQAHYRLAEAYRQTGNTQQARQESQIFQELSATSAQQLARQRADIQKFVIALKGPAIR